MLAGALLSRPQSLLGVGLCLAEQPLGLGLGLGQVLVRGLLGQREHLHGLGVLVGRRRGRRRCLLSSLLGLLSLRHRLRGLLLRLLGGQLSRFEVAPVLGQLLLGLCQLLLHLHNLLLRTVLALVQGTLQLADVRLHAGVLVSCGGQFGRARATAGRSRCGLSRGSCPAAGPQVVVLLDETRQLDLDNVEEGVDLFLVVSALADRRFLERDVVHFSGSQRHTSHLGCSSLAGSSGAGVMQM